MSSLLHSFRRFWFGRRSRSGNVAIIFSLAIVPIVGGVGAAVDYSMANSNRTSMQKALDATALALAKLMPLNQTQLDEKGWQLFSASLGTMTVNMPKAGLVITTPTIGKIHLTATGQYTPQISGFMGISTFPVTAETEVQWGMKKLELALALDNTGSMADNNKMTELKKAAKNLLTTLQASAMNPGDVKVAIIPFHKEVRVDTSVYNYNGSWLKWSDWDHDNQNCSGNWWNYSCSPKNHNTWDGCIMDRDQSYDSNDTAPTSNATKFPAKQCSYSLTTMMPLNYDWTALANKIDAMQPNGNTNVTIGLVWAWHALTTSEPLTQAAAPANDLSKYIILMTDGENTQNRWSSNSNTIDNRTAATCTNLKAAGIRIYTIRVIDGNADLLRNCASDPSMYFDVQTASQLTSVFNSIGATLAQLHLSQ
ncbi:MAG: VWA domain-containing protein [Xanthobacteraceae bacterium]|nr:VWA domain-containing protein [Xanthobacteraceae bacterium]